MERKKSRTAEVERIFGLGDADAERLLKHNVRTPAALWGEGGSLAERLGSTAEATGVKVELLYTILIADALGALKPKGRALRLLASTSRRKGEMAFVALLLLVTLSLAYQGWTAGRSFAPRVAVKAGSKLTPFHAIDPADLTLEEVIPGKGTFSSTEEVAGRYPSELVPGGKTVTESQLLRKELSGELAGRHLLILPVKRATAGQAIETPATVWILLPSPEEKISSAALVKDVLLLAVKQDGERVTATIAVTEDGLAKMKDYMGRTEAIVIQPAAQASVESLLMSRPSFIDG
jgi:hypothetical protein